MSCSLRRIPAGRLRSADHARRRQESTIAAVQGACIAGGLMLCWPCDLIVAADDAWFSDPVARMGIGGVEYHGHTWELGARKAKEFLFTGKRAVNQTLDIMGFYASLQSVFDIHYTGHGNALSISEGKNAVMLGLEGMKKKV